MRPPGALAEWLGSGLQSRLQRFESARRLLQSCGMTRLDPVTGRCESGPSWGSARRETGSDVPDMDAVMNAVQTEDGADAMAHDGVLPETLVMLVEQSSR